MSEYNAADRVPLDTRYLHGPPPAPGDQHRGAEGSPPLHPDADVAPVWSPSGPPTALGVAALRGPAGNVVAVIGPHSEADTVALLVQCLVMFGNVIGRGPHFKADGVRHSTNLFACLVGETSKSRKGTSWNQVRSCFAPVDPDWASRCIASGLSSGEGLIHAVRDAVVQSVPFKEHGRVAGYEDVVTDPGVEDKRLLAFEGEFAAVLHMLERDGNTLSATMRSAWDSGDLRILTRNSPVVATAAHISMVAHITRDEVCRYLDRTEMGNGFANRYLWLWVTRSKLLPDGGALAERDVDVMVADLRAALEFSRQLGEFELKRDDAARALWHEVYAELSAGRPGLVGAITSRAEAQVMRLACVYALLDRSRVIARVHLEASLGLWRYAEESARFIFGNSLGDPDADAILLALRSHAAGMTRSQIRDLFGGHRTAHRIERALSTLLKAGQVQCSTEETGGRPAERWRAV